MKTLYLLRHAKSSWDHYGLRDHDRPLATRGKRAAPAMGHHMRERDWIPELVLCSTSVRTRQTLELVEEALDLTLPTAFEGAIYGGGAGTLFGIVQDVDPVVDHLMVIGHNPGMEDLALTLAGRGEDEPLKRLGGKYPTAALAVLQADVDEWSEARPQGFTLIDFVRPRDLIGDDSG